MQREWKTECTHRQRQASFFARWFAPTNVWPDLPLICLHLHEAFSPGVAVVVVELSAMMKFEICA